MLAFQELRLTNFKEAREQEQQNPAFFDCYALARAAHAFRLTHCADACSQDEHPASWKKLTMSLN